jgi:hypothetical protein
MRKKDIKIAKNLTTEEFEQLRKCRRNIFYFATFIYLIHPKRGKVKFDLYDFQRSVVWQFLRNRFNIILKFRQAGVTELISMFCLWLAMYHSHKNIVILSIKDRVAKKVLRKIKFMYRNLPDHLKIQVVNGRGAEIGTSTELEFANGSIISSIPTTEDAGRSEGLSLLVIDEAAIIRWANQIWAAAFPTLSTGGSAIVNSTPYGVGGWFHKLWVTATSGGNDFVPIRLRWQMHPERYRFDGDMEWYNMQRKALGPRRTAQEIDGDFLTSGNSVFDLMDIKAIEDMLDEYNQNVTVSMNGQLKLFGDPDHPEIPPGPKPNVDYFIGGDCSTGRSQDYSTFTLMDRTGEEWGNFKGKIPPFQFAKLLMKLGKTWNYATLAPESNDIGLAVTSPIEEAGYKRLYYSTRMLKEKGEHKRKEEKIPGWYTTKKTRPVMISTLEEDIRQENIVVKDKHFVDEAYTFIYDDANRPVAMGKGKRTQTAEDALSDETYTDDAIMGKAITNIIRKGRVRHSIILPR